MARRKLGQALRPLLAAGLLAVAGASAAAPSPQAAALIAKARDAIAHRDGLGAEVQLKAALAAGASREDVAARLGEAYFYLGKRDKAREWLAPGRFAPGEAAHGFHLLGLLEHSEGKLLAALQAYNQAILLAPKSVSLWVDLGYLRYARGEHVAALEAANYALSLDPANVRALEFKGRFVRDQYGLAAALPWFQAALERDPGDLGVLGEYAATLGDLGRATDALTVTRTMLARDGRNARALFLQALIAARAGDASLSRSLLNRTGDRLQNMPARLLLDGLIQLQSGNNLLAIEAFEKLVARQPANPEALALLARCYFAAGNFKTLVDRFGPTAARSGASSDLLTLVARAYEELGQRDLAVPLLERAARSADMPFSPVPENQPIGALLAAQRIGEAEGAAEQLRKANPGSANTQALAGDVQLLLGHGAAAAERYRLAAVVRMPESLVLRLVAALGLAGQGGAAGELVESQFAQSPSFRTLQRLAAAHAAAEGDWARARLLLEALQGTGSAHDVRLLADLALTQLRTGDAAAAEATAREAYHLQPSNAAAARAWGMCLTALKQRPADARALLAKVKAMGG